MTGQICFRLDLHPSAGSALSESMKPAKLFPMFLKLSARPCLVVRAGTIAESKIGSLLEARGRVRVVAPEATPQVRSWAHSNSIECAPERTCGLASGATTRTPPRSEEHTS